ncbi:fungal-specific transcription factor domain-containing protein [Pilaira anomala]|nr:fungal-specific transcription factor domain-containing protein [Pilaira anomala]
MYDIKKYDEPKPESKKRVRASQACVHCRKKKIKCDESRPDCTQCQDANIACEYTEPKKRGPRKGYVQLLEERLAQMERKLMGPTSSSSTGLKNNRNILNDDESNSLSSSSIHATSPIQLYGNPDNCADLPPLDIVIHLVDLFFKYINSLFPFVHRIVLKKSIKDGTVSRPLLYSVLAISARFSDNPSIRTDPPYLAGEKYAQKALSLVDAELLEPNLANIQFWGIMSCLEYGHASGSKSWIYSGLAVRFCQELGYYKEETMRTPILAEDGSIDTVAMALRRRVFWSCLSIDKLSSAGTHRPQCIERSDCDTVPANISECLVLRDPTYHKNIDGRVITDDSLMNIATHYMRIIESYGEVNRFMNRAKSNSASIVWPPIAEFRNLDMQLRAWQENLPETFHFNQKNLDHHRQYASGNYLNIWLSSHAIWCSSMMILHRGSLAFSDIKSTDVIAEDLYRRIQQSIDTCRMCVDAATGVFGAIKDLCGFNILPYMGYSAYVFATVLMTSTFSSTPESCKKSSRSLKILYDLIDGLRPYWPMCERLADATRELLVAHQRLYDERGVDNHKNEMKYNCSDVKVAYPSRASLKSHPSSGHSSPTISMSPISLNRSEALPLSTLLGTTSTSDEPSIITPYSQSALQHRYKPNEYYMPPTTTSSVNTLSNSPHSLFDQQQRQQPESTALSSTYSNWNRGNEIDFNSLEFLYDTGLFGQVVFDANSDSMGTGYPPQQQQQQQHQQQQQQQQQQQSTYENMMQPSSQSYLSTSIPCSTPTATTAVTSSTTATPTFQPMISQQQQTQSPTSYNPSKSLWN